MTYSGARKKKNSAKIKILADPTIFKARGKLLFIKKYKLFRGTYSPFDKNEFTGEIIAPSPTILESALILPFCSLFLTLSRRKRTPINWIKYSEHFQTASILFSLLINPRIELYIRLREKIRPSSSLHSPARNIAEEKYFK